MRIALCDDDAGIIDRLQKYISEFFEDAGYAPVEIRACLSGDELLAEDIPFDIALLDVEMPGKNGIFVGKELKKRNPDIKIFIVTSYPDYLDDAMRFQVFRYLSKPINKSRLFRNLKDAVRQYNSENKEIIINEPEGIVRISASDIVCVEYVPRKTLVYTPDSVIESTDSIEYWQKTLSLPGFYLTYRSFIVNMRYVYEIKSDTVVLKYAEKTKEAYLARRRHKDFCGKYLMYLEAAK